MSVPSSTKVRWGLTLLLAVIAALAGCFGGQVPDDQYYRLELDDPETRFDPPLLNGTLQVSRPSADALTGERHLLYRQNSGTSQLHRHAYHRWVDSPTLILQHEIVHYLRSSRLAEQVVTPELRAKADYALSCRIANLERVLDTSPRVILELELGITNLKDRQVLLLQTYREERQVNGSGVSVSIAAYNVALANILNRFLADMSGLGHTGKTAVREIGDPHAQPRT